MSDSSKEQRRTLDEWYKLVTQCRQSGLSDEQWCLCNGIKKYSLYSVIKRLRQKAYAVPKPMRNSHDEIHDLTLPKQDVVQVDIIDDIQPPKEYIPSVAPHLDNSHTIEINLGRANIRISNTVDLVVLSETLKILGTLDTSKNKKYNRIRIKVHTSLYADFRAPMSPAL